MPLKYDVEIDVSGKEQDDRTTIIAYLSKLLTHSEEEVIIQHADPQIDDKLVLQTDELRERLKGKTIFVREIMHD
jgi:hypothetical protein